MNFDFEITRADCNCSFGIKSMLCRVLDRREYLMIIQDNHFSMKQYVVTPHPNRLVETETVQMRGHNIRF